MERPVAEYQTIVLLLLLFRISAELQRRMRRPGAWNPHNDFQRHIPVRRMPMRMQQQGGQENQGQDQYQEDQDEDEEHEYEEDSDSDSYEEVVIEEPPPKRHRRHRHGPSWKWQWLAVMRPFRLSPPVVRLGWALDKLDMNDCQVNCELRLEKSKNERQFIRHMCSASLVFCLVPFCLNVPL